MRLRSSVHSFHTAVSAVASKAIILPRTRFFAHAVSFLAIGKLDNPHFRRNFNFSCGFCTSFASLHEEKSNPISRLGAESRSMLDLSPFLGPLKPEMPFSPGNFNGFIPAYGPEMGERAGFLHKIQYRCPYILVFSSRTATLVRSFIGRDQKKTVQKQSRK